MHNALMNSHHASSSNPHVHFSDNDAVAEFFIGNMLPADVIK